MEKKKLIFKDYIKEGMEVCIGAKDGSNYMFIGPYNEAEVTELFELYYAQKERNIPKTLDIYKGVKRRLDNLRMDDNTVEYLMTLKAAYSKYHTYYKTRLYVENYKPLLEREIVRRDQRITDNCEIIMIEGSEQGKYWTREEYLNDPKKGWIPYDEEEEETE